MSLQQEQEIIMNIADMAIQTFNAESALLRLMKMQAAQGEAATAIYKDVLQCYFVEAMDKINQSGRDAINAFASGDEQRMMLLGLKRFTKLAPANVKDARRRIADKLITEQRYSL